MLVKSTALMAEENIFLFVPNIIGEPVKLAPIFLASFPGSLQAMESWVRSGNEANFFQYADIWC